MAKQLSMEDLIKKYQYLRANQQSSSSSSSSSSTGAETNQKTNDKDNSEFSTSNVPLESASLSSSSTSAPASSEDACKVCLDAEANCAFIECGHIVSCLNCAKLLTKCPICRESIKRTLRVYKS